MTVPPKEPQQSHKQESQKMTWIRKQDQYSNEECTVALQACSVPKAEPHCKPCSEMNCNYVL
jgi:hypothetical protein